MFHKNKNIKTKFITFVSIGFILKIIILVVDMYFNPVDHKVFMVMGGGNVAWYMFVLAGYTVVSYFLRNTDKRFILFMAVLLGCFAGYDRRIGDFLYLSKGIIFYPFFVLGQMISKEKILSFVRSEKMKLAGFAFVLIWLFVCTVFIDKIYSIRPFLTARTPFCKIGFVKNLGGGGIDFYVI